MVNTLASPGELDWKKMKVQELRDELASRGLETTGLKASLIERLEASDPMGAKEGEAEEEGEAKKDIDIDMNEKVLVDDSVEKGDVEKTTDVKLSTEKVAEAGADAKPVADVCDATNGGTEEATVVPSEQAAEEGKGKPLTTDLEKKRKRAERFGLELMVSEVDKRRLRAVRFGCSPTNGPSSNQEASKMSPTVKEMEAVKRKARAARFQIKEVTQKPVDDVTVTSAAPEGVDDAKKKSRLARFGPTIKLDPKEQEKKRLRAARSQALRSHHGDALGDSTFVSDPRFGIDTGGETKVEATNNVAVAPPATS